MQAFFKVLVVVGLVFVASCESMSKFNPFNFGSGESAYDESAASATSAGAEADAAPLKIQPIKVAIPKDSEPIKPKEVTPAMSHIKAENTPPAAEASFTETALAAINKFIPKTTSGQVKAGVLLPLSGKSKSVGEALQTAAMMALAEGNNKDVVLQFYDTRGTGDGASEATKKALAEGVDVILGPLFSAETKEVADTVGWSDINVIGFSSDPGVLSDKVFSVAPLVAQQVEEIVGFACSQGYKKFAVLAQNNEMGEGALAAANNAASSEMCGGEVTGVGLYDPETTDFSMAIKEILPEALLAKLERENLRDQGYEVLEEPLYDSEGNLIDEDNIKFDFDAVLLVDEGTRLRSLGALLEYYDINPKEIKVLGVSMMDDSNVKREASLIGAWYSVVPKEGFDRFAVKYKNLTGAQKNPPRIASLAYDAVALTVFLAGGDGISSYTLTNPSGFKGVSGVFRLLADGRAERALAIMEVTKSGKNKVLRPARKSFAEPAKE